jgi:hypothetical protein
MLSLFAAMSSAKCANWGIDRFPNRRARHHRAPRRYTPCRVELSDSNTLSSVGSVRCKVSILSTHERNCFASENSLMKTLSGQPMWMAGKQAAAESNLVHQQHSKCQAEYAGDQSKAL